MLHFSDTVLCAQMSDEAENLRQGETL
jgi:hypothetical protein